MQCIFKRLVLPCLPLLLAGCCGGPFVNCKDAAPPVAARTGFAVTFAADIGPAAPGAAAPATRPANPDAPEWKAVAAAMGRAGVARGAAYTVTVPRDDLFLVIEGNQVPVEAGLESRFHFYPGCCGKLAVVGEFCALEYEVNDVIDALRAARLEVVSVGSMLLHTRQAPMVVRFQGEGDAEPLAKAVREALRWTGKERMAPDRDAGKVQPGVQERQDGQPDQSQ